MKNLIVEHKVKISANFTAEDWQLYLDNEHAEEVADKLNRQLEFLVNSGFPCTEVSNRMWQYMSELSKYGANDSEAHYLLEDILESIYPNEPAIAA